MKRLIKLIAYSTVIVLLAGCAPPKPTPTTPVAVPIAGIVANRDNSPTARELMHLLVQEEYQAVCDHLSLGLREKLTPERLEEAWKKVTKNTGPYQKVISSITEQVDGREKVTITGEFENGYIDLKLFFDDDQITGLFVAPGSEPGSLLEWTQPDYICNETFYEIDVIVGSAWALPGTLSMPIGEGPFPAVILVHGSGPQDRDETLGPNKPFLDLAWGLASQGVAVLRYDKRTLVHAERVVEMIDQLTVQEETVEDALLAVDLLRKSDRIDPENVFVLGHSLGGMVIPRIGEGDPDIAGFIILAGAALPWEEMVYEQILYILNLDGSLDQEQQTYLDLVGEQVERIKSPDLSINTPPEDLLGLPASYWLDIRGYDPAEQTKSLKRPTLVLQGGRDYQVTEEHYYRWKTALADTGFAEFKFFPSLNHLFIHGEGIITPTEYSIPGNVEIDVVDDIARWILNR
jgi:uncharacterized protein